ncbi:hypothetical protein K710_2204 [Streptococcus iniae SF1]|nr:hypothetical protein K710_2204 [Streptococcus iniae SF1]
MSTNYIQFFQEEFNNSLFILLLTFNTKKLFFPVN